MFLRNGFDITKNIDDADIVVFNGGEDINPRLYGEMPIDDDEGWYNKQRDADEIYDWHISHQKGQFKFGICRGGQLLNVMNGGKLWQDVDNHGRNHPLIDIQTQRVINTTSVHHQAFRPGPGAEIVAKASRSTHKIAQGEIWEGVQINDLNEGEDIEILWYPETRSLCIQGHPEYHDMQFRQYCFELLERYYG